MFMVGKLYCSIFSVYIIVTEFFKKILHKNDPSASGLSDSSVSAAPPLSTGQYWFLVWQMKPLLPAFLSSFVPSGAARLIEVDSRMHSAGPTSLTSHTLWNAPPSGQRVNKPVSKNVFCAYALMPSLNNPSCNS